MSKRSNRKKRALDWVVNPTCWFNRETDAVTIPGLVAPLQEVTEICALTVPAALNMTAGDLRAAYFQDDVTAVRVKGSIHWRFSRTTPIVSADQWWCLQLRIIKASADPDTGAWPWPGSGYLLEEAGTADESFLWHHEESIPVVNQTSWLAESYLMPHKWYGTIPVDVGVSRRLEPHEALFLVGQLGPIGGTGWDETAGQNAYVVPRLRTLLRETR